MVSSLGARCDGRDNSTPLDRVGRRISVRRSRVRSDVLQLARRRKTVNFTLTIPGPMPSPSPTLSM